MTTNGFLTLRQKILNQNLPSSHRDVIKIEHYVNEVPIILYSGVSMVTLAKHLMT